MRLSPGNSLWVQLHTIMTNKKIGILGVGMVGGAHKRYFEDVGYTVVVYDPPQGFTDTTVLTNCEAYIVCVPTPFSHDRNKSGFDASYVEEALKVVPKGGLVIIKSTILPGTTEKLQKEFPQLNIIFSPEFLTEATADHDTRHPARQIVGYTAQSKPYAQKALDLLPSAPFHTMISSRDAEMVKYFSNTFYATKIIFANQIYDLCQKLGIDYDVVRESVQHDPMIAPRHLDVMHKGYRGYGGACLPKDTKSLIQFGDDVGQEMKLLKLVEKLNDELVRNQKKN